MKYYPEFKKRICKKCEKEKYCDLVLRFTSKNGCLFYSEKPALFPVKGVAYEKRNRS